VVDWLDGDAAWRPAEPDEPDELVDDDELVDEVPGVVEVAVAFDAAATVVGVEPLLAEARPPCESSSPPVRAMAPATLAAAAIRRPLQAGWGRRRRPRAVAGGAGGGGGALGEGASMRGLRS